MNSNECNLSAKLAVESALTKQSFLPMKDFLRRGVKSPLQMIAQQLEILDKLSQYFDNKNLNENLIEG